VSFFAAFFAPFPARRALPLPDPADPFVGAFLADLEPALPALAGPLEAFPAAFLAELLAVFRTAFLTRPAPPVFRPDLAARTATAPAAFLAGLDVPFAVSPAPMTAKTRPISCATWSMLIIPSMVSSLRRSE
jgi:hypothetical protein